MDLTKVGVRTRAEALDMTKDSSGQMKRRKVEADEEVVLSSSSLTYEPSNICKFHQASISQGNAVVAENESQHSSFSSDDGASCCSSYVLSAEAATDHKLNSADLEVRLASQRTNSFIFARKLELINCTFLLYIFCFASLFFFFFFLR